MGVLHRKNLSVLKERSAKSELKKNLTYIDITLMGIGVIVGTGIFVLTGIGAATYAGPGMILSFVFAGITCTFVGLAYAELASMMPMTGSVYTYTYTIFGEILAWVVGWALVLEYFLAGAVVANGWSAYLTTVLAQANIIIPKNLCTPLLNGGIIDLPAAIILGLLTLCLIRGTKESAVVNRILVVIKLAAIFLFLFFAIPHVNTSNWVPFLPFGVNGIFTGASFAFLAYLGFDMLSNMTEESVKPSRDIPIGIIASLVVVTILYVTVTATLTGVVNYMQLDTSAPVAFALSKIGYRFGSAIVGTGVIFGLTAVILVALYAQGRLFLAMSRDGLIPKKLCKIHPKYKTPYLISLITGVLVIIVESIFPINILAELINMGTLFAFTLAAAGIFALRIYHPEIERPFKCPKAFIIMPLGIICCIYLIFKLQPITWEFFIIWTAIGLMIYLFYGYWNSNLHKAERFGALKNIVKRVKDGQKE